MADYDQFIVKFARLMLKVQEVRGKILDEVIFIEFILDLIILKYFCESTSKIGLFQATLLNQEYVSFDSKIRTFKNLKLGRKYEDVIKTLGSKLNKTRKIRNSLAHRMIDSSEEAVNSGKLRLIYYEKGKKKYQQIEEKYLENNLKDLKYFVTDLLAVLNNADFGRSSKIDISVE